MSDPTKPIAESVAEVVAALGGDVVSAVQRAAIWEAFERRDADAAACAAELEHQRDTWIERARARDKDIYDERDYSARRLHAETAGLRAQCDRYLEVIAGKVALGAPPPILITAEAHALLARAEAAERELAEAVGLLGEVVGSWMVGNLGEARIDNYLVTRITAAYRRLGPHGDSREGAAAGAPDSATEPMSVGPPPPTEITYDARHPVPAATPETKGAKP